MSILPVLGHKPITSYFSRTSSAKRKRKEVVDNSSTEGISKRPKQSAGSSSSRDRVDFLCSPPGNHSWTQGLDGSLPTPPLTCIPPVRPRKCPAKELISSTYVSVAPWCREDEPEDSLPSPSPKESSASFLMVSNDINDTPTIPVLTVPSSQSQDSYPNMEIDMLSSFSKTPGNSSFLRPTDGEDLIIESSQSQLLIIASPNVRKLESEPTLPVSNVVIPSSQSQEQELTIPMEIGARGGYFVGIAQRAVKKPQRTLSKESFSIPIQDSILDNLFSEEQAQDTPVGNNPNSGNPTTETEDEHEGLRNFYKERSLEPTSWNPAAKSAARVSSDSQSSLGTSLPPEVWEFRKMFENGDESYPADFPESLRS